MSLHRVNPRRDANEPEIRARFAMHGWHTEQVSGKGMPDLMVWAGTRNERDAQFAIHCGALRTYLVDVKMPKGGFMPAQEKKWAELAAKGIPVYVARTEADVDAIVAGTAEPWRPSRADELRSTASRVFAFPSPRSNRRRKS